MGFPPSFHRFNISFLSLPQTYLPFHWLCWAKLVHALSLVLSARRSYIPNVEGQGYCQTLQTLLIHLWDDRPREWCLAKTIKSSNKTVAWVSIFMQTRNVILWRSSSRGPQFLILKTGQRGFNLVHSIGTARTQCKDLHMSLLKVNALVLRPHFSQALGVVYNSVQ